MATAIVLLLMTADGPAAARLPALLAVRPPLARPIQPAASQGRRAAPLVPEHVFLRQYDRNGDYVLSKEELPRRLEKRFRKTDRNSDGRLDASEILYAKTRIGVEARKAEEFKLDRKGKLTRRLRGNDDLAMSPSAREQLRRIDRNQDGVIDGRGDGAALQQPALQQPALQQPIPVFPSQNLVPQNRLPQQPTFQQLPPAVTLPPLPRQEPRRANPALVPAPPPVTGAPISTKQKKKQAKLNSKGFPTADQIIDALDKNKNGVIDRHEAVDKLADNFQMLDRDKNNALDKAEIERSLRLARLFGIKPSFDPRQYKNGASSSSSLKPDDQAGTPKSNPL